ncbi:unnamed protein product, partial [Polarella glacialis]
HISEEMVRDSRPPALLSCWGAGFTKEDCCHSPETGMFLGCWDGSGLYSYEACCSHSSSSSPANPSTPWSTGNLTALTRAVLSGQCVQRPGLGLCAKLWLAGISGAVSLTTPQVQRVAELLATGWSQKKVMNHIADLHPSFAVSVGLHAALAMVDRFAGQQQPLDVFQRIADLLQLYRSYLVFIDPSVLGSDPQAGGMRIADLDEVLRLRFRPHYHTVLHDTLVERITDLQESGVSQAFESKASPSYAGAFHELLKALHELKLDY